MTDDAPLWEDGWYRFARQLRSPNFGPRPAATAVTLIVVHCISLPPGCYGGDEVQQLFTNQLDCDAHAALAGLRGLEVSSHFYIRRHGELWQFVSCDARAWHAGASAWRGRGNCNDYSVGIELEGAEGESFEDAQYETLSSLCASIGRHYPIEGVAGHQHVAPGRKTDPGAGFDWPGLRARLGWPAGHFPDAPTGG